MEGRLRELPPPLRWASPSCVAEKLREMGYGPEVAPLLTVAEAARACAPSTEDVYRAVERAYWRYVRDFYGKRGRLLASVDLRELLPLVREELERAGYEGERVDLKGLFELLKKLEAEKLREEGEYVFHVGLPDWRGPDCPIPLRFYRPDTAKPEVAAAPAPGGGAVQAARKVWVCRRCGHVFETPWVPPSYVKCPRCGSGDVHRVDQLRGRGAGPRWRRGLCLSA